MKYNINIHILFIISIIYKGYCDNINCNEMPSAFEPSDCFTLEVSSNLFEKCCLLEYKSKQKERKFRKCLELTLEQFMDIDKTIMDLENNDQDLTITSLECDKSSILVLSKLAFIFALLLRI